MLALRYVYVLALVVWLGGMVVLGAIVAPATFQVLQASAPATGRALAGAVFGDDPRAVPLRRLRVRRASAGHAGGDGAARPAAANLCRAASP